MFFLLRYMRLWMSVLEGPGAVDEAKERNGEMIVIENIWRIQKNKALDIL